MATFKQGQRVKVVSYHPECPADADMLGVEGFFETYHRVLPGSILKSLDGGFDINAGADCIVRFDYFGRCYCATDMLAPVLHDGNQIVEQRELEVQ